MQKSLRNQPGAAATEIPKEFPQEFRADHRCIWNMSEKAISMSELKPSPPHLLGGNFLLADTSPSEVFTPEDLSSDQRLMAETAVKFMDKEVLPQLEALEQQKDGLGPSLLRRAGALGLLCMEIPEEYGGLSLGKTSACGVEEQLSRLGGFGVTCGAHSGIGTQPLIYFGTEAQKRQYLPKLAAGEWIGAYALSEAGSGSDALGLRTKATLSADGKHYLLNGTKMWISNAGWADLFTIFAKVEGRQVTAFLVERAFPGVSTGKEEHKLGIKSSSTCRVILEDVLVPVENVLGEVGKGAYIAFNILNLGRFKLGAGAIGGAREALKVSTRYALEREQFGRPIASFGLMQQKLAEMAAKIFAGESAVYRTAGMMDSVMATGEMIDSVTPSFPRGIDEFAIECSIIKVACSEIMDRVADEMLQIHGGYGYTENFRPPALTGTRASTVFLKARTRSTGSSFPPCCCAARNAAGCPCCRRSPKSARISWKWPRWTKAPALMHCARPKGLSAARKSSRSSFRVSLIKDSARN